MDGLAGRCNHSHEFLESNAVCAAWRNDRRRHSHTHLLWRFKRHRVAELFDLIIIKIDIKRDGKVKQIEVVLRNTAGKAAPISKDDLYVAGSLGGEFADLGEKAARQLGIKGGVKVTAVREGGFLAKARVRPGFVITHVNEKAVTSVADLDRISEKVTSVDGIYPQTGRSASYSLVE